MTPAQKRAAIEALADDEFEATDWWTIEQARDKQLPPPGDWFCWLIRSGRGYGKTRIGSEWVIRRARYGPYFPIALVGQSKADVRDTMIEIGESSILKCSPSWFRPEYEPSKRRLTWPNGMIATAFSGDEPDQLRGPQHGSAWLDELAKFRYPQETWDNLSLGLRLGPDPCVVVTTTPRPIAIIRKLIADPETVDMMGSTFENAAHLSPRFIRRVRQQYENTRLGRQELEGQILDDTPGALWTRSLIEQHRVIQHPPLARIVVAVDPHATVGETGIVVAGLGGDGHGYVLDDRTLGGSPAQWARAAVTAFYKFQCDRLVYEANQGGDMVAFTIATVDPAVPLKAVHASRGKFTRAEPIAALYERGRVHHVGMFADLEDQMCTWVPGEPSPDRMDALVWALTELFLAEPDVDEMVTYDEVVEISPY